MFQDILESIHEVNFKKNVLVPFWTIHLTYLQNCHLALKPIVIIQDTRQHKTRHNTILTKTALPPFSYCPLKTYNSLSLNSINSTSLSKFKRKVEMEA